MAIEIENINGVEYYKMTSRGVAYTLYFNATENAWGLYSRKSTLRTAGHRYFDTLGQLENTVKAFRGISALLA